MKMVICRLIILVHTLFILSAFLATVQELFKGVLKVCPVNWQGAIRGHDKN